FWRKTRISAADMLFLSVTYSGCRVAPAPVARGRAAFLADDAFVCDSVFVNGIEFFVAWLSRCAALGKGGYLEVCNFLFEHCDDIIVEATGFSNVWQRDVVQTQVLQALGFEAQDVGSWNLVHVSVGTCPDR